MRKALTYILALMLMACSSSSGGDDPIVTPQEEEQQTMLSFYVYSPEHPILTRGNAGESNASEAESRVNSLQIWVFESATGKLAAYYKPSSTVRLNGDEGNDVYQMPVSHDFANRRPRVDVYVLANATTNTLGKQYDENTTRTQLKEALLDNEHFGSSSLTKSVPADGLPMSGVLLNQPVTGEKPVLRVGTDYSSMATVRLVRMVSKLHFAFSALTGSNLKITGITFDDTDEKGNKGLLAYNEFLFLKEPYTGRNSYVSNYIEMEVSLLPTAVSVLEVADPLEYVFVDGVESAQEYETRILKAINATSGDKLTSVGPYYLHESDKKLKGKVTYTVSGGSEMTAPFEMADAGDFSRNHTWLVYAYYGDAVLEFNLVDVNSWQDKDVRNHDTYNW